jgi:hypothetical protein
MSTLPRLDDKGTWHLTESGHFQQFVDGGRALLAAPPRTPPTEVDPREAGSASDRPVRSAGRTIGTGGLSTPPNGIRDAGGLRLPAHRLPDRMVEQFGEAIDRRDDGPAYGPATPGGRGEEAA